MSSFKKAIPKRKYRERSQPENRKNLGFLEKKKDYKKRAEDTHKKEKELERLKNLAFFRNPDEFYFGMENTQIVNGKHRRTEKETPDKMKKKQKVLDGNLLTMKAQNKAAKVEKLRNSLHLVDAPSVNTHVIFVENEKQAKEFDLAKHFDTVPELVHRKSNRLRKDQLETFDFTEGLEPEGYKILEDTIKEERLVRNSLEKNILEKKFLAKDKFSVIDEDNKIFKWFRERKR